jgi:hypothetical protein
MLDHACSRNKVSTPVEPEVLVVLTIASHRHVATNGEVMA